MVGRVVGTLLALVCVGFVGCAVEDREDEVPTTRAFEAGLTCETNGGIYPLKAALAVAMATEIGRLDPLVDLAIVNNRVVLTAPALDECSSRGFDGCPNTDALLGMQDSAVNEYVPQYVFNAVSYREDLKASFDRQRNHEQDLANNAPNRLPKPHTLWHQGISDYGACGVHYDFSADGEAVDNIVERLVFFGGNANPFIDYRATEDTVSIDPTATMNGNDDAHIPYCYVGCYAYSSVYKDKCCICDGNKSKYRSAPWDRKMFYCAY